MKKRARCYLDETPENRQVRHREHEDDVKKEDETQKIALQNMDNMFKVARDSFFLRDMSSFIMSGFYSLLTVSMPWIIRAQSASTSVVFKGLKYGFSFSNVKVNNQGVFLSECFKHQLSLAVPITADFQLDVTPLLSTTPLVDAKGLVLPPELQPGGVAFQPVAPKVLSRVRAVVFHHPIPTGRSPLWCSGLEDQETEEQNFYAGVFICNGRMRTMPCGKAMFNNEILLSNKKKCFRAQCRSSHEGNRSTQDGNPFRSTSSIEFEISKARKRSGFDGEIKCVLPFSKQQVHIGILALALGCTPDKFVDAVHSMAGKQFDSALFRPYDIDILLRMEGVPNQEAAVLILAGLNNKLTSSTGVNLLKTEIFPHLNVMFEKGNQGGLYLAKTMYLARITAKLILFAAGRIPETSRDLWQHSSLEMPAVQIARMVRAKLLAHMAMFNKLLRRDIQKKFKTAPEKQAHVDLVTLYAEDRLSNRIMRAMATGGFSKKKLGVTIPLNDHNNDAMMTQLMRISSSMRQTDSVHIEPRKVPVDSYAIVCAASTPDGEQVGLVNELACTATVTTELDDPRALCELVEQSLEPNIIPISQLLPLGSSSCINILKSTATAASSSNVAVASSTNAAASSTNAVAAKKRSLAETSTSSTFLPMRKKGRPSSVDIEIRRILAESINGKKKDTGEQIQTNDTASSGTEHPLAESLFENVNFANISPDWYLFINNCGVPTHYVKPENVAAVVRAFRLARRQGEITRYAFLSKSNNPRELRVTCESGQIARPLIVLENLRLMKSTMTFWDAVQHGVIEYVNAAEISTLCKIAVSPEDIRHAMNNNKHQELTHLEFTQASFLGLMAASIVHPTSNQGPRISYADNQRKQVIRAGRKRYRGSVLSTEAWYNFKNLMSTDISNQVPDAIDGGGHPCSVLILCDRKAQEDAYKAKKQCQQRGGNTVTTTRHYTSDIKPPTAVLGERFERPVNAMSRKFVNFSAIGENGLAARGKYVEGGEAVMAKTRRTRRTIPAQPPLSAAVPSSENLLNPRGANKRGRSPAATKAASDSKTTPSVTGTPAVGARQVMTTVDISITARRDEAGTVQETRVDLTPQGKRVRTAVATPRPLVVGSKLTTDQSQKGVCGELACESRMPFGEVSGVSPDLVVSELGIVARMTPAFVVEAIVTKALVASGYLQMGRDKHHYTRSLKHKLDAAGDALLKIGLRRNGTETYRCGITGKKLEGEVFSGFVYYKPLNHLADKKLQFRSIGRRCAVTRQSSQGKQKEGGLRFGEYESSAATAQGGSAVLQARLMHESDPSKIFICSNCRHAADGNRAIGLRWCRLCKRKDTVSELRVPYTFVLCLNELAAVGVKMLIRTKRARKSAVDLTVAGTNVTHAAIMYKPPQVAATA